MSKLTRLLLPFLLALSACSDPADELKNLKASGGARYGGTFRFMSQEKITTLFPLQAVDVYNQRITSQIFDPLLSLDPTGKNVIPCIAESFTVSKDAKEFTFVIRKGVYFHDDECFGGEGRELTAQDVKFTLDMACSGLSANEVSWLLVDRVAGARKFFDATTTTFNEAGVDGIQVTDKNTLKIILDEPCSDFDKIMTFAGFGIFPKEAYEHYKKDISKHPVGTGPFMLKSLTASGVSLERNPHYWKKDDFGNQLPFVGEILVTYANTKRSELLAFRKAEIDLVLKIPADEVQNVLGSLQEAQAGKTVKHKVDSKQSASIAFLGLSHTNSAFKDVKVRKALNMAIDRDLLVNSTLLGEGYPAKNGIIPNTDFYNSSKVKGFSFNVARARELLSSAGFPNGEGFPALTIYASGAQGSDNHLMALGISGQLQQNLNLMIAVKLVSSEERNKKVASGEAAIWVSGWVADYPDPENFLSLFYGGNITRQSKFINPFKYKNSNYDNLFLQANRELDPVKRMKLLVECDQILIDDAVVIPVLSNDFITLINSRVRNFETNSLETIDLSRIFIKELK